MADGQCGSQEPLCVCSSRLELSSTSDRLCGWESLSGGGDIGCALSAHCKVSQSPGPLPSPSDTALHHGKNSATSIARSDSRSSLRSLGYELPQIPSSFAHSEGADLAREASGCYRKLHTYPSLEKRVRKDSGLSVGAHCTSCVLPGPAQPVPAARVKPKLLVFGETRPFLYAYTKPSLHKKRQVGNSWKRRWCMAPNVQLVCCLYLQIEPITNKDHGIAASSLPVCWSPVL